MNLWDICGPAAHLPVLSPLLPWLVAAVISGSPLRAFFYQLLWVHDQNKPWNILNRLMMIQLVVDFAAVANKDFPMRLSPILCSLSLSSSGLQKYFLNTKWWCNIKNRSKICLTITSDKQGTRSEPTVELWGLLKAENSQGEFQK